MHRFINKNFILGLLLLFTFWLNPLVSLSQEAVVRAARFGGLSVENSITGVAKNNGGYRAFGKVGYNNYYILDYDIELNEISRRNIGNAFSFIMTADGGFITINTDRDVIHNWTDDYCVAKYDLNGVLQWRKFYGGLSAEIVTTITQLPNGNFLVAGITPSIDGDVIGKTTTDDDVWIIELNPTGQIVRQKVLGGSDLEETPGLYIDGNNIFVYCHTRSLNGIGTGNQGSIDLVLMRLDANLNLQWSNCIGGSGDESISTITTSASNEIYIGGNTNSTDGDIPGSGAYTDGFVLKVDFSGNIIWSKLFSGSFNDQISQVTVLSNGNIAVAGWYNSVEINYVSRPVQHVYEEGMLIVMNSNAETLWSKSIGGECLDMANGVIEAYNGNLIVYGFNFYCSLNGDFAGVPMFPGESNGFLMEVKSSMNTIKGSVYFDSNNNGINDVGENYNLYGAVETSKGSYSTKTILLNGKFLISTDSGDYSTSLRGTVDTLIYGFSPKKKPSHFSTQTGKDSFDFRILPIELVKDLDVSLVQLSPAFIDNSLRYRLYIKNRGGAFISSATIRLKMDGNFSTFTSTNKTFSGISNDTVRWEYTNIPGGFYDSINIFCHTMKPPLAVVGNIIQVPVIAEPYYDDFDTLDNKTIAYTPILGQNSAVSNFNMSFTPRDSAGVNRNVQYSIIYGFTHVLDSLKGVVKIYKSSLSDYVAASPEPFSISGDTIQWKFKNLSYLDNDTIKVTLRPKDTSALPIGSFISHQARVELLTVDTTSLFIAKSISQLVSHYYVAPDMTNNTLQPPNGIRWTRSFGGTGTDGFADVIPLQDTGFLAVGSSSSRNGDIVVSGFNNDAIIARYNKDGGLKWLKIVGSANYDDNLSGVIATSDNNFLATGSSTIANGSPHGYVEAWVVKFNEAGDTLWTRKFGSPSYESFSRAVELPDKGFLLVGVAYANGGDVSGYVDPGSNYKQNGWVVKIDSLGRLQWQKCINEPLLSYSPNDVKLSLDGKIIIAGTLRNAISPTQLWNGFLIKMDTGGTVIWNRKFSFSNYDHTISSVNMNADSSMIIAGRAGTGFNNDTAYIGHHGDGDVWIARLDKDGIKQWERFFGGTKFDNAYKLVPTASGNFLLAGSSRSSDGNVTKHFGNSLLDDGWIIEMNPNGNLIWQKTVGGSEDDFFNSITELRDGSILAVGVTATVADGDIHGGHGEYDALLVKIAESNFVSGVVYVDRNNNGIKDDNDPSFSNGMIVIEKTGFTAATAPLEGNFALSIDTGKYYIHFDTPDTAYYNILPSIDSVQYYQYALFDTVNFRFVKKGEIKDLRIDVLPVSIPRPGFVSDYVIRYENKGTNDITNAEVKLIISNKTDYFSSIPPYTEVHGDTLIWDIDSLKIMEAGRINLSLKLKTPPVVQFGDSIFLKGMIEPVSGDSMLVDNISEISQLVRGSYDPNDKSEIHGGKITPQMVEGDEYLTYVIRFQNTGNDTAFNVVIRDTLDQKLDWTSMVMVGGSHPYELAIKDKNKIEWFFNNILLPDSNINEPKSHGFLSFRIKLKKEVQLLDTVSNNASIYFDFNLPVKTNDVKTAVDDDLSAGCIGSDLILIAKYPGVSYRWQVDMGSGYIDIEDNNIYEGAASAQLKIKNLSSSWAGYRFRCKINVTGGIIYGPDYKTKIQSVWKGTASKQWEDPANWNCGIVPDENTDIVIEAGLNNYPEVGSNANCRSILIKPSASITIKPGFNLTLKGR